MTDEQHQALVPLADVLPELREEDFVDLNAWDAGFLRAEALSGVYLARIRDMLTQGRYLGSGLWTRYLHVRGLNEHTARARIAKAEGHPYASGPSGLSTRAYAESLPEPQQQADDWRAFYQRAQREAAALADRGDYEGAHDRLDAGHEAAQGALLAQIRAELVRLHETGSAPANMWQRYLDAHHVPLATALDRIAKAQAEGLVPS